MERAKKSKLAVQMIRHSKKKVEEDEEFPDGDFGQTISSGSTLLDLNISGGRKRGGGFPGGIVVEGFGPPSSGKSVLLAETAGDIIRKNGEVQFKDPEARLNEQFAKIYDFHISQIDYDQPDTVSEVFESIINWKPKNLKVINGIFTDSLAALSTDLELSEKGDKMGTRRAKELSEGTRKAARIIKQKNYLMISSNQIRDVIDAAPFSQKYVTPGGHAYEFYSSLRLRFNYPQKIERTIDNFYGKSRKSDEEKAAKKKAKKDQFERVVGIQTTVEVVKSSIWKPYRSAPIIIDFDYGIDDIRANLQFIKNVKKRTMYTVGHERLSQSLEESIDMVESNKLIHKLKEEVIDTWEEIEEHFKSTRKKIR